MVQEEQVLRKRLEADFQYNMRLLQDRDAELARYESAVTELKLVLNALSAESSELKVRKKMSHPVLSCPYLNCFIIL